MWDLNPTWFWWSSLINLVIIFISSLTLLSLVYLYSVHAKKAEKELLSSSASFSFKIILSVRAYPLLLLYLLCTCLVPPFTCCFFPGDDEHSTRLERTTWVDDSVRFYLSQSQSNPAPAQHTRMDTNPPAQFLSVITYAIYFIYFSHISVLCCVLWIPR